MMIITYLKYVLEKQNKKQGPEKLAKIISFLHKNFLLLCFSHFF